MTGGVGVGVNINSGDSGGGWVAGVVMVKAVVMIGSVIHPSFLGARKKSTCYSTAPTGGRSSAQTTLTFLRD